MSETKPRSRLYNVVDLETTDMEEGAEILEMASCLLLMNADRETFIGDPVAELFKPVDRPFDPAARAAHHISPAMVADRFPITEDDRRRLLERPGEEGAVAILAAHNCEFERRFLKADLPWICTYKAALRVFPEAPSHKNGALYYWLMDQGLIPDLGDRAQPMHRAGPDTLITAHLLAVLLTKATTHDMIAWTAEPKLLPTCPIGDPWRGKPWAEVEHGFLKWMANKAGMDEDNRWNAQRELDRRAIQSRLI